MVKYERVLMNFFHTSSSYFAEVNECESNPCNSPYNKCKALSGKYECTCAIGFKKDLGLPRDNCGVGQFHACEATNKNSLI